MKCYVPLLLPWQVLRENVNNIFRFIATCTKPSDNSTKQCVTQTTRVYCVITWPLYSKVPAFRLQVAHYSWVYYFTSLHASVCQCTNLVILLPSHGTVVRLKWESICRPLIHVYYVLCSNCQWIMSTIIIILYYILRRITTY